MARLHQRSFNAVYERSLLYNACWEDPKLDRVALRLGADSEVLMITSAGCNALDYALDGPRRIHAVDANPRQTALLELKIAGIKTLAYEDFWQMFGLGVHRSLPELYRDHLRRELRVDARAFWDRRLGWWTGRGWRDSFYYYGLSGLVARLMSSYIQSKPRLRRGLHRLFRCADLDEQQRLYREEIGPALLPRPIRWLLNRPMTMYLMGVPQEQGRMVAADDQAGVAGFVQAAIASVCQTVPMADNYFYRVYVEGRYSGDCCPEYLKPNNFAALKAGMVDAIVPVTSTLTDYLRDRSPRPSHCVLLDHMDWMGSAYPRHLAEEWHWLMHRARPGARVLFRSGAREPGFLDMPVSSAGESRPMRDWLRFDRDLADRLHPLDRVHTYSSFHIGDLGAPAAVA